MIQDSDFVDLGKLLRLVRIVPHPLYLTSSKHEAQNSLPHVSHRKLARDMAPRDCAQTWHRSSSGTGTESAGGRFIRKEFRKPNARPMSVKRSAQELGTVFACVRQVLSFLAVDKAFGEPKMSSRNPVSQLSTKNHL